MVPPGFVPRNADDHLGSLNIALDEHSGKCDIVRFLSDESLTHKPITAKTVAHTNWYLEIDLSGAFEVGVIRRIFLSLPNFFTRKPDPSIIVSETNEPADGTPAGDKLVSGLRGDAWAMVHLLYRGSVTVGLARALPGAPKWRAWWIDPGTGGKIWWPSRRRPRAPPMTTTCCCWSRAPEIGSGHKRSP